MILTAATAELLVFIFGLILNLFTLPTLFDSDAAIPRLQSMMSAISLFIIAFSYLSLGLALPAISVGIGSVFWTFMFIYRPTEGEWLGIKNIINKQ